MAGFTARSPVLDRSTVDDEILAPCVRYVRAMFLGLNGWFVIVLFYSVAIALIGSVLYLVGTIVVTIVFNVPRNNALAAVEADSADGATQWAQFTPGWTAWNHLRTIAALAAAASFTIALCSRE